jgi:hypothetical protein
MGLIYLDGFLAGTAMWLTNRLVQRKNANTGVQAPGGIFGGLPGHVFCLTFLLLLGAIAAHYFHFAPSPPDLGACFILLAMGGIILWIGLTSVFGKKRSAQAVAIKQDDNTQSSRSP